MTNLREWHPRQARTIEKEGEPKKNARNPALETSRSSIDPPGGGGYIELLRTPEYVGRRSGTWGEHRNLAHPANNKEEKKGNQKVPPKGRGYKNPCLV